MGNVIPWSQIHPSITSQEPFVAVVVIDPQRQICVSEMVPFELDALANADVAAPEVIAAAQAAAAKVASGYRARRKQAPKLSPRFSTPERGPSPTLPRKRVPEKPSALTLALPLDGDTGNRGGLRVLEGGKR